MNAAQHILVFFVRAYQRLLSPIIATLAGPLGRCRFELSCSQYAVEAIRIHGALKGTALALGRLCRCSPWGGCGDDPVPPRKSGKNICDCAHDKAGRAVLCTPPSPTQDRGAHGSGEPYLRNDALAGGRS